MILPEIAKHFLVFIATTWQYDQKHQFTVGWYALHTIKAPFLVCEIRKLAALLSYHGFIMDTIVGDGASKNRSSFKLLSTVSARKIIGNHYTKHQLRDLPLDFKIGFPHPHPQCWKHGIIIVIGGGMPHWGEKFCNAFDNKSRDLLFLGKLMNLPSCVASRNTMQVNMFSFDSKVNARQALVESANYFVPVKPAKKKRKLNKE